MSYKNLIILIFSVILMSCQNSVNELSEKSSLNCDEPTITRSTYILNSSVVDAIFEVYNHYNESVYIYNLIIAGVNNDIVLIDWDRRDFKGDTVESGTYVVKVSIRTIDEHFSQCEEFYINKNCSKVIILYDLNERTIKCSTS